MRGALEREAIAETRRWVKERAERRVGLAVTAAVRNLREDGTASTKIRPCVLVVRRDEETWGVIGLTTVATYRNGSPRTPVPDWDEFLDSPGYVWGPRLAFVPDADLNRTLGPAPPSLLRLILDICTFTKEERATLERFIEERETQA